jgi:hypothetical protein
MVEGDELGIDEVMRKYNALDADRSGHISWEEMQNTRGPPKNEREKLEWYWDTFAIDKERGMTFDDFVHGSMVENKKASVQDIVTTWDRINIDKSDALSYREFMILGMPDNINGRLALYWELFAREPRIGMTLEEFLEGYSVEHRNTPKAEA